MCCNDLPLEVGPTEETVDALLDYLVGPYLPLNHFDIAIETPTEAQQKSVAKQVHAAAVLYNYVHLNHHKESQFLMFDQFCNLAIMFKPNILHHMKYMCQSDRPNLDDPENQLSLTEKAVMDACTLSETLLNASDNISNIIKEWSITKVAVLLIDSKMENCFLKHDDCVWSVIEKEIYLESKTQKKTTMNHDEEVEARFQKLAFLAVEEATGNVNGELKDLETHVVYSLSQAKTATRFYIVQSMQSISKDYLDSIQNAICRFDSARLSKSSQGIVVKESLGSWVITPVVEWYYYLIPYADIVSKFFSRLSNALPHHVEKISADANFFQGTQNLCEKVDDENKVSDHLQKKSKLDTISGPVCSSSKEEPCDSKFTKNKFESNNSTNGFISSWLIGNPFDQEVKETKNSTVNNIISDGKKEDMHGSCGVESNNSSNGANSKSIDRSLMVDHLEKKSTPTNSMSSKENLKDLKKNSTISQSKDERVGGTKDNMHGSCAVESNNSSSKVNSKSSLMVDHLEKKSTPTNSINSKENLKDLKKKSNISQSKDEKIDVDRTPTMYHDLEDIHSAANAKRSELSEAALRALLNKKQKLYHHQEVIESELIVCDNKIQKIIHGGIGDYLGLKLEAVIDCCNETCEKDDMQTQQHTNLQVVRILGKSLSEAQLTLRKPFQELDDLCLAINRTLSTYHTSRSDGVVANFEGSVVNDIQPSILEARKSATEHAITRLKQMVNEIKSTYPNLNLIN